MYMKRVIPAFAVLILLGLTACNKSQNENPGQVEFCVGADRSELYLPLLKDKRVALFTNQSGLCGPEFKKHTLDFLLEQQINVTAIFSPEHGFRGNKDAGESVDDTVDEKTGIRIYSLYDNADVHPSAQSLKNIDVIVCDIQDVGMRFYTYGISMINLMESAVDNGIKFVVFDRPNPNGNLVDGPLPKEYLRSNVCRIAVPVSHGLTLGEMALMTDGEGWLDPDSSGKQRKFSAGDLVVIPCAGYSHDMEYELPVRPSPNLPVMHAVYLYPSLCPFEGTVFSVGRGTDFPFEVYGHPLYKGSSFEFIPLPNEGAKFPPHKGKKCCGVDLRSIAKSEIEAKGFTLEYVIDAYSNVKDKLDHKEDFFIKGKTRYFFDLLMGSKDIRLMILEGKSAQEISETWQDELVEYRTLRNKYLIYN